jgi:hypothetical protein
VSIRILRDAPVILLLLFAVPGCSSRPESVSEIPPGWADSLGTFRTRVDEYFRSEKSPLLAEQRQVFTGLHYYPLDPSYRFVARLDTKGAGGEMEFPDTQGNVRRYTVHGKLHLTRDGQRFTLTVLRSRPTDSLFLPFQDATTGTETYQVGRYVDVTPGPEGTLIVDFNTAKNPYCAYNDNWACPLVPPENRLPVPILAGEKSFHP